MFEIMEESRGQLVGVRAVGAITRADYDMLTPLCEEVINREGTMRMLFDMQDFELEEPMAWRADFHFGREFHNKIERMAIVGNERWEEWMTDFCRHFYAQDAAFFRIEDIQAAWDWLREGMRQAA